MSFITVLTFCIYCHYFWTIGVETLSEKLPGFDTKLTWKICKLQISNIANKQNSSIVKFGTVWFYFNVVLSAVLPFTVISILLVTYCVKRRRQVELTNDICDVSEMPGTSRENAYLLKDLKRRRHLEQDVALAETFIANVYPVLCVSFLLCSIPASVLHTYDFVMQQHNRVLTLPYWGLLKSIVKQLKTSFYAVKVVIYIICSEHVRNETGGFITFLWKSLQRLCRYISCQGSRESAQGNQTSSNGERASRH